MLSPMFISSLCVLLEVSLNVLIFTVNTFVYCCCAVEVSHGLLKMKSRIFTCFVSQRNKKNYFFLTSSSVD